MKKGLFFVLIFALLLSSLASAPVKAVEPLTHPVSFSGDGYASLAIAAPKEKAFQLSAIALAMDPMPEQSQSSPGNGQA